MKLQIKGFTLIEIVITIAIIVILSLMSAPMYTGYSKKTKMAEGYSLLAQIRETQINYYNEYRTFFYGMDSNGIYADSGAYTQTDPVLGVDARSKQYFKSFKIMWDGSDGCYQNFSADAKSDFGNLHLVYDLTLEKMEYSWS